MSVRSDNPWITDAPDKEPVFEAPRIDESGKTAIVGPRVPQAAVVTPPESGGLPIWNCGPGRSGPPWWWVGSHGGAGVTTLDALLPGGAEAGRNWPVASDGSPTHVIVVARTDANGLKAAQTAARQWASGTVPGVVLLGLAAVADAVGKPPKPLADLLTLVVGGYPHVWNVPWIESLRWAERPPDGRLPKPLARMATDLARIHEKVMGRQP